MQQFHWEVKKIGDAVTSSQEEVWDNIVQLYGDLLHNVVYRVPLVVYFCLAWKLQMLYCWSGQVPLPPMGESEPSVSSLFNGLRDANACAKSLWGKPGNARISSGSIFMLEVEFY